MKIAASNIGWTMQEDEKILDFMANNGFSGLEIAPTRVFAVDPYDRLYEAEKYADTIFRNYGLKICSIQSILYGKTERVAETAESRASLLAYTKNAILFASVMQCPNLVFGCPKNRAVMNLEEEKVMKDFLFNCGEFADIHHVVVAIEPNPSIYNTNYLNTTEQTITLLKEIGSAGLALNLDFGAVIENHESLEWIKNDGHLINHVHISEPRLAPIKKRTEHFQLHDLLKSIGFKGYFSLEMASSESDSLHHSLKYMTAFMTN